MIIQHYIHGWFAVDLISSLPLDEILPGLHEFRVLRVVRLIRLLRLQKLVRYYNRFKEDLSFSHTVMRLMQLFATAAIFVHMSACALFFLPSLNHFPADSWVQEIAYAMGEANVTSGKMPSSIGACYTHSAMQALSHMLGVGYGFTTPSRLDEIWMLALSMIFGSIMYALGMAFACSTLQSVDDPSRRYQQNLEALNEFMRVKCLPKVMREKLRHYVEMQYPNRRTFDEERVEKGLSAVLLHEVNQAFCQSLFEVTPMFADADPLLLSAIADHFRREIALLSDWLIRVRRVGFKPTRPQP